MNAGYNNVGWGIKLPAFLSPKVDYGTNRVIANGSSAVYFNGSNFGGLGGPNFFTYSQIGYVGAGSTVRDGTTAPYNNGWYINVQTPDGSEFLANFTGTFRFSITYELP